MKIAMSAKIRDRSYYLSFDSDISVEIGEQHSSDLYIPELGQTIRILCDALKGTAECTLYKTHQSITIFFDKPTLLSKDLPVIFCFTRCKSEGQTLFIPDGSTIWLGRADKPGASGEKNIAVIPLPFISHYHMSIRKNDTGTWVIDNNSKNGTFLNGKRVYNSRLQSGDVLSVHTLRILFNGDSLSFENAGEGLKINSVYSSTKMRSKQYPFYMPSTRIQTELPTEQINIKPLPAMGEAPKINWLSILLPPIAIAAMMLIMSLLVGSSSMLYMLPMQLVGVIVSIVNYRGQKKQYKTKSENVNEDYLKYLNLQRQKLENIAKIQREKLTGENPSVHRCFHIVSGMTHQLWERMPGHSDFMNVSVGLGSCKLCVPINAPVEQDFGSSPPLEKKARSLAEEFRELSSVPVCCDLLSKPSLGVVGNRSACISAVKTMIIGLTTLHSYENLKIILIYPTEEETIWGPTRFLPHAHDEDGTRRYIASSKAEAEKLLEPLLQTVSSRVQSINSFSFGKKAAKLPHMLFVIAAPEYISDVPDQDLLLFNNPDIGVSTVVISDSLRDLPPGCIQIMEVRTEDNLITGKLYESNNKRNCIHFTSETIFPAEYDTFVRNMAPIKSAGSNRGEMLPSTITFLQANNVRYPQDLPLESNWMQRRASESMSVPIGMGEDDKLFYFDINRMVHGASGLIGGTTGSGKTELLQTWILEMATNFPPTEVNFALFDFKGTGLLDPFEKLPHMAGMLSNLDLISGSGKNFELRYQAALNSEITRRQAILSAAGCGANIFQYHKKFHRGEVNEPLPFLMIILDEFGTIKADYPNFMATVNTLYQQGGNLGIHVLLSTQTPANSVSPQVSGNAAFKWCLRAEQEADSTAMLGVKDAAHLPKIPGRVIIQVKSRNIYAKIQSIFSGAKYDKTTGFKKPSLPLAIVRLNGSVSYIKEKKQSSSGTLKEIDAVVEQICKTAKRIGYPPVHQVWLPPLPGVLSLQSLMDTDKSAFTGLTATVGLLDSPSEQAQYSLHVPFGKSGNAIIYGGPKSGKSFFMYTVLRSLTMRYSPYEVRLYIIDCNSGNMNIFRSYPHVAKMALPYDDDNMCLNILNSLEEEMAKRAMAFFQFHATDILSYNTQSGKKLPYILLAVDEVAKLRDKGPDIDARILSLMKDGPSKGIYILLSASQIKDVSKYSHLVNREMNFVLQMNDTSSYMAILNVKGAVPDARFKGRGIYSPLGSSGVLEFQTALPAPLSQNIADTSAQLSSVEKQGQKMKSEFKGIFHDADKVLPDKIPYGSIDTEKNGIILGLSLKGVYPVMFDPKATSCLTFVGNEKESFADVLLSMYKQARDRLKCERIFAYDLPIEYNSKDHVKTPEEMERLLEELRTIIAWRINDSRKNLAPVALLINGLPQLYESVSKEYRIMLDKILLYGSNSYGMFTVSTGSSWRISQMSREPLGNIAPAAVTLFRRNMVIMGDGAAEDDERFKLKEADFKTAGKFDSCFFSYSAAEQSTAYMYRRMLGQ